MTPVPAKAAGAPYPGLRFFDATKAHLFFGRDRQVDDLLDKLTSVRLVGVVGPSGGGKSSLVLAGVLPELKSGWKIARCQPRAHPIAELAQALGRDWGIDGAELTLRRGSLGLRDAAQQALHREASAELPKYLVVVDQFEEVFRYGELAGGDDESSEFVRLLLAGAEQHEIDVRILLTMRSEYLGRCSQFRDLPERLNEGLYLVPRMSRDQLETAITAPVGVVGGTVAPRLVQRLLNDLVDDPDQLPVLQHALLRTWNRWREKGGSGEIDLEHYRSLQSSLEEHAEDIYKQLTEGSRRITETLFRCLTAIDDGHEVRRPAAFAEILAVSGASAKSVAEVVKVFRGDDVAFLNPERDAGNVSDADLDITHESLIRQWSRLRDWTRQEDKDREIYVRTARYARTASGDDAYLGGVSLQDAVGWLKKEYPAAWAERYSGDYEKTVSFIQKSLEKEKEKKKERDKLVKQRQQSRALLTVALVALVFGAIGSWLYLQATNDEKWRSEAHALAADALGLLNTDPEAGVSRAAEAVKVSMQHHIDVEPRVEEALLTAFVTSRLRGLLRHEQEVTAVAYSPAGDELATASVDGTVRIWNPATGKTVTTLHHDASVGSIRFDTDGKRIVTASDDGKVTIWKREGRSTGATFGTTPPHLMHDFNVPVSDAVFSRDGKRLAIETADQTVELWNPDTDTGKPIVSRNVLAQGNLQKRQFQAIPEAAATSTDPLSFKKYQLRLTYGLAFSPDGRWLAISDSGRSFQILNGTTLELKCAPPTKGPNDTPIHDKPISAFAFSSTGALATAGMDGTIRLWDVSSCRNTLTLRGHEDGVTSISFSQDGLRLASASLDKTVRIWDAATGQLTLTLRGHEEGVLAVAFNPDGTRVASGGLDKTARFWEVSPEPGDELRSFAAHNGDITSVAWSPDARKLATGSFDSTAKIWDASSDSVPPVLLDGHTDRVRGVAFSADGKRVATASDDRTVIVYDSGTGKKMMILKRNGLDAFDVAFSPDGRKIVTAGADSPSVTLWDAEKGVELPVRLAGGYTAGLTKVVFSPAGNLIGTAGCDGTAILWDEGTGKFLRHLKTDGQCILALAFSPDGKTVATGGFDRNVRLWDSQTGELKKTLKGHEKIIYGISFSGDGKEIASASGDKTIRIWNVDTGGQVAALLVHERPLTAVAFAPKGHQLAAGTNRGDIAMFTLDPTELLNIAAKRVVGN